MLNKERFNNLTPRGKLHYVDFLKYRHRDNTEMLKTLEDKKKEIKNKYNLC